MSVSQRIHAAEAFLPGVAAPEGEKDPRWQAIIAVGEFIDASPHEVWQFVARWGCTEDDDLQDAVACCLLEHLLENHFDAIFPLVRELALTDARFYETFRKCWRFGRAELPGNRERFDALMDD